MKKICLAEYDSNPCGEVILVDENSNIEIIATVAINWLYRRIQ